MRAVRRKKRPSICFALTNTNFLKKKQKEFATIWEMTGNFCNVGSVFHHYIMQQQEVYTQMKGVFWNLCNAQEGKLWKNNNKVETTTHWHSVGILSTYFLALGLSLLEGMFLLVMELHDDCPRCLSIAKKPATNELFLCFFFVAKLRRSLKRWGRLKAALLLSTQRDNLLALFTQNTNDLLWFSTILFFS